MTMRCNGVDHPDDCECGANVLQPGEKPDISFYLNPPFQMTDADHQKMIDRSNRGDGDI